MNAVLVTLNYNYIGIIMVLILGDPVAFFYTNPYVYYHNYSGDSYTPKDMLYTTIMILETATYL